MYRKRIRFNHGWGFAKQVKQRENKLKGKRVIMRWTIAFKLGNGGKDTRKMKCRKQAIVVRCLKVYSNQNRE